MAKLRLEEEQRTSCRAIAYFVRTLEFHDRFAEAQSLVLKDLCWRLGEVDELDRALILAETSYSLLPKSVRESFSRGALKLDELSTLRRERKEHKNIGIVTSKAEELRATLMALGLPPDTPPRERSGEFSYWLTTMAPGQFAPLTVVVTLGEPRNVPCAIAVEHLLGDFGVDLLILVGIAAGPKGKVKLGDVVYAEEVYDYEEFRLELASVWKILTPFHIKRPRPKYVPLDKRMKLALERLDKRGFQKFFAEQIAGISTDLLPAGYVPTQVSTVHDGIVAAGEKLIADGSLKKMVRRVDERIRAGAMEDSGFAQAANFKKIRWCIFRGVSDFGDPRKATPWQFVAAFAAACAAIYFLRSIWAKERYSEPEGATARARNVETQQ